MNFLIHAFSESNGSASSMRLLTALVVIAIMVGWLSVTVQTKTIAELPIEGPGGIILGALGIKAWQRTKESKTVPPNGDTTTITKGTL